MNKYIRHGVDYGTHEQFYEYYAKESLSSHARERFLAIRDTVLRAGPFPQSLCIYDIADVGCGAGTQSLLWAELGHRVHAVDVNQKLLELARSRATESGYV